MEKLTLGNIVSLTAAFFILILLIEIFIKGIGVLTNLSSLMLMWLIWILSIPAYLLYKDSVTVFNSLFKKTGLIAIILTFLGLIILQSSINLGLLVILMGYFFEPLAGFSLYKTISLYQRNEALIFYLGAIIYTLGLPLYLYNLLIIAIIGNIIKIFGLYLIVRRKLTFSNSSNFSLTIFSYSF